jgi:hypothetical protein
MIEDRRKDYFDASKYPIIYYYIKVQAIRINWSVGEALLSAEVVYTIVVTCTSMQCKQLVDH